MWDPLRLTTLWASTAYYRDSFTVTVYTTVWLILKLLEVILQTWATSNEKHISNESRVRTGN
jgi:hypothetical protein